MIEIGENLRDAIGGISFAAMVCVFIYYFFKGM